MELKTIIANKRSELGLTLEDVAKICNVSISTVKRWESGEIVDIKRDKVVKLAQALHTTPAYIMGWEEEDKTKEEIDRENQEIMDAYNRASPEIRAAIQRILKD